MMFLRKDPMKRAHPPAVVKGAEVFTADGRSLGVVEELDDVSFKVNVSMAPDYWLGRDYVIEASPERVTMSFLKSELGGYRLGQPGLTPDTDTTQAALTDRAVPEERQAEQRVRMEQELAEQRQRLPHTHPEGEDAPPDTMGGTIGEPVEDELRDMGVEPKARKMEQQADDERWSPAGSFVEPDEPSGTVGDAVGERAHPYEAPRPNAWPKDFDRQEGGAHGGEFGTTPDTPNVSSHETAERPHDETQHSYYEPQRDQRMQGGGDIAYSVPTREDEYDPAAMRKPATMGMFALAIAGGLFALAVFMFASRRRRREHAKGVRHRAKHLVRDLRQTAQEAVDSVAA
jgi:hypothetical protein